MKILLTIFLAALVFIAACGIQPRNTLSDCQEQCKGSKKSKACYDFCDCIHKDGHSLDSCLNEYNKAPTDPIQTK
jgi:hypothetical protein